MVKLLKHKTNENVREEPEVELENELRRIYTPTKIFRINSTQNYELHTSRNTNRKPKPYGNKTLVEIIDFFCKIILIFQALQLKLIYAISPH